MPEFIIPSVIMPNNTKAQINAIDNIVRVKPLKLFLSSRFFKNEKRL